MQPKTEEFLNFLLWSADMLTRPTVRNLTGSYEGWVYRKGLTRQLATLQKHQLVKRNIAGPKDRLYRLTEQGRLHALGGRDPQIQWSRYWDGRWRMVLFDVPIGQNTRRAQLRRYLRARSFGCAQGSVWISPDPLHDERDVLAAGTINVDSLLLVEAWPCAGENDAQIVAAAWDFARINRNYARHLQVLDERPRGPLRDGELAKALQRWAAAERRAWLTAVAPDPLLPERLLPRGYLGGESWKRRTVVLRAARRQLHSYRG